MISAATTQHLVVRRHVDLGRTRSMICPAWRTVWAPAAPWSAAPRYPAGRAVAGDTSTTTSTVLLRIVRLSSQERISSW